MLGITHTNNFPKQARTNNSQNPKLTVSNIIYLTIIIITFEKSPNEANLHIQQFFTSQ